LIFSPSPLSTLHTIKILHISPSYWPATIYGGPTLSVSRLCEAQAQAGAQVRVLTTTANGRRELDVPTGTVQSFNGVEVIYYPRLTGDHSHFSPRLLLEVWRQCRLYDAVHIHSWWNTVAVGAALICKMRGVRFVVSPRGMLSPYTMRSNLKLWLQRVLGNWVIGYGMLHATSRQEAEECQRVVPGWRYFIAPNIIPLPKSPITNHQSPITTLLFLSRIDPKKGLEILFHALSKTSFPYELKIAGSGEDLYIHYLKNLAAELGIAERIEWLGWVEGDSKFRTLADADLLILTSQNENFANVVLESLAVGTPVLVSDQVGLSDYVRENDLGWVAPLNAERIAEALEIAFQDAGKRNRIRERAPGVIRRDFDAGKVARGYLEGYKACLQK